MCKNRNTQYRAIVFSVSYGSTFLFIRARGKFIIYFYSWFLFKVHSRFINSHWKWKGSSAPRVLSYWKNIKTKSWFKVITEWETQRDRTMNKIKNVNAKIWTNYVFGKQRIYRTLHICVMQLLEISRIASITFTYTTTLIVQLK